MDPTAPPGQGDPRERTLSDGTEVKWCSLCAEWGNHYRAGHPADNVAIDVEDNAPISSGSISSGSTLVTNEDAEMESEAVARLKRAGLMF